MKKLFYLPALGLILLAASCNNGELPSPKKPDTVISVKPPHCDSVKLLNYVITNLTGNSTYEISFRGAQNYWFTFPPYGSRTISVKPGTYSISVFTPKFDEYPMERFQLDNLAPVHASSFSYDHVVLSPCAGPHTFSITP
jgi:hypothetical protein